MKALLLSLTFLLLVHFSQAQNAGDEYVFKQDFIIQKFDSFLLSVVSEKDTVFQAKRGMGFTIRSIQTINNIKGYCIVFWGFSKKGQQIQPLTSNGNSNGTVANAVQEQTTGSIDKYIGKEENGMTFFILDTDLKASATDTFQKQKGWFNVDGLVLPIKLRFKTKQPGGIFDFEQSVSVGPAISYKVNHDGPFSASYWAILGGFNITNVSVDNNTVANGLVSSKTTVLALSPFIGFSVQYHSISFSVMTGYDIIPGQIGDNWAYRNSPWLGIGIGTSIISPTTTTGN